MKSFLMARYKAYTLALAHLKENESITNEQPVFAGVYQSARALLDEIDNAEKRRAQKVTATTEVRDEQHMELARLAFSIASVLISYAEKNGDTALRTAMTFAPSELTHATPHELGTRAANILVKAQELKEGLKAFGVREELLEELAGRLEKFSEGKNAPRNFISERKQAGELVEENLRRLTEIFNGQLDGIMQLFSEKHPEFYTQYRIKRAVVHPGRRKTRVEGVITGTTSGEALAGVEVSVKNGAATTVSESDGSYYLNIPPVADIVVVYKSEGYKTSEIKTRVKRGQALRQNLAMDK